MSKDLIHLGARQSHLSYNIKEAEEKYPDLTPYELGQFRNGYYIGLINQHRESILSWLKYLNRDELMELEASLAEFVNQYHTRYFGN